MIKKEKFVEYANALRKHTDWINKVYELGINIETEPLTCIGDALYDVMLESNMDYDYDDYAGISWVAYWCSSNLEDIGFRRMKQWVKLEDAGALYDFVTEMAALGWPEKIENEEWLM